MYTMVFEEEGVPRHVWLFDTKEEMEAGYLDNIRKDCEKLADDMKAADVIAGEKRYRDLALSISQGGMTTDQCYEVEEMLSGGYWSYVFPVNTTDLRKGAQ